MATRKDPPNMNMMGNKEKQAGDSKGIIAEGKGANVKAPDQSWADKHKPISEKIKEARPKEQVEKEKPKNDPHKDK